MNKLKQHRDCIWWWRSCKMEVQYVGNVAAFTFILVPCWIKGIGKQTLMRASWKKSHENCQFFLIIWFSFHFFFTEILKMFRGGAILPDFWCTGVLDSVHIVLVWRLLCFETSDFVLRKPTTCFIDRKPIFRDETDSGTDHHLFWHRAFS